MSARGPCRVTAASVALHVLGFVVIAAYLAQHITSPPNSGEGAVMMDYVHRVGTGQKLYFDYFDYYGPLAWLPYGAAYALAGHKMIGARLLIWALKLTAVVLGYVFVRRLASAGSRLYAALGALTVTVLIGQSWPFFQIPYAPHLALPLLLSVWLLLFEVGARHAALRVATAGVLTGCLLWTKVNTGAFVLAGGAVYLVYWLPAQSTESSAATGGDSVQPRRARWILNGKLYGLLAVAIVFHLYSWKHLRPLFFIYLTIPLAVAFGWTALHTSREPAHGETRRRMLLAGGYVAASLACWAVVLLGYFGRHGWAYLTEQAAVLSRLRIARPIPAIGEPGQYSGFNEYFWPQLPWLLTAIAVLWVAAQYRGPRPAGPPHMAEARLGGLFMVGALHTFVICPRGDESHLIQAVLPAAVLLFAMLANVDALALASSERRKQVRAGLALATVAGATTIVSVPAALDYQAPRGQWSTPRLDYLRYHSYRDARLAELSVGMPYHRWDALVDDAAQHIRALTDEGEEVMVLGAPELLNLASHTTPGGGKYSHLVYLRKQGLLDEETFVRVMPKVAWQNMLERPPRVLVLQWDSEYALSVFPELAERFQQGDYQEAPIAQSPFLVYIRRGPSPGAVLTGSALPASPRR